MFMNKSRNRNKNVNFSLNSFKGINLLIIKSIILSERAPIFFLFRLLLLIRAVESKGMSLPLQAEVHQEKISLLLKKGQVFCAFNLLLETKSIQITKKKNSLKVQ